MLIINITRLAKDTSGCVCEGISREDELRGETHSECGWCHPTGRGPKQNKRIRKKKPTTADILFWYFLAAMR
jgi:hypothetical protein